MESSAHEGVLFMYEIGSAASNQSIIFESQGMEGVVGGHPDRGDGSVPKRVMDNVCNKLD